MTMCGEEKSSSIVGIGEIVAGEFIQELCGSHGNGTERSRKKKILATVEARSQGSARRVASWLRKSSMVRRGGPRLLLLQ